MLHALIATWLCRAWEALAWHSRQRHHYVPWPAERLAEYMEATERYNYHATVVNVDGMAEGLHTWRAAPRGDG